MPGTHGIYAYIHNQKYNYLVQPVIHNTLINPSKCCIGALFTGDLPRQPKPNLKKNIPYVET
jgi:hypothetical protein